MGNASRSRPLRATRPCTSSKYPSARICTSGIAATIAHNPIKARMPNPFRTIHAAARSGCWSTRGQRGIGGKFGNGGSWSLSQSADVGSAGTACRTRSPSPDSSSDKAGEIADRWASSSRSIGKLIFFEQDTGGTSLRNEGRGIEITATRLHNKAQGQRRSRATLGCDAKNIALRRRRYTELLYNAFGVKMNWDEHDPECASRLWALLSNAFGVKPAISLFNHLASYNFKTYTFGSIVLPVLLLPSFKELLKRGEYPSSIVKETGKFAI